MAGAQGPVGPAGWLQHAPGNVNVTVTTVPLLVHEQQATYGFLKADFAKGGMLEDKEVWGWAPSDLIVSQGDTITLSIVNPGDDPHTFVVPSLKIHADIKERDTTKLSFVAKDAGVYQFFCDIPEHFPYMSGSLLVVPTTPPAK